MRQNKTKAKVNAGQVAFGVSIASYAPEVIEMAGALGFDFATLDWEHELIGEHEVLSMVRTAEAAGLTPIVRAASDPDLILRCLDSGAHGIHVPRVNSGAEAQAVIDAALYYPLGKRTFYALGRGANYGVGATDEEHAESANRETLVICMVEEVEGVQNLQSILAVPHLDAIHIGPKDLWQSMGMPAQSEVARVMDDVIRQTVQVGKTASLTIRLSPDIGDRIADYVAKGVRMFQASSNDLVLHGGRHFLEQATRGAQAVSP